MCIRDRSEADIAAQLKALIITKGGNGSIIYADGQTHKIPAGSPAALADPTGCGDAFRAGLIYGISRAVTGRPSDESPR